MKITLATIAALAATASAFPTRIITFTNPPPDYLPAREVTPPMIRPPSAPCHGKVAHAERKPSGSWFNLFGSAPSEKSHHHPHHEHHGKHEADKWDIVAALQDKEEMHRAAEEWKEFIEELFEDVEDEVVPVLQGGAVKILPVFNEDGEFDHHAGVKQNRYNDWKALEGKGGVRKAHHRGGHHGGHHDEMFAVYRPREFSERLSLAFEKLTPTEATAVMFVLGAGLGSLLHLCFAIVFITFRRIRKRNCRPCGNRRASRAANRLQKASAKQASEGQIALPESENEHEEVLPSYAEGETDRLVEKA